jgi:FMN phosphatase YigB (HAD superfamily)
MPTLLSVDIWDTLLRRRCHPDEVKLFTARRLWVARRAELRPRYPGPWQLLEQRVRCEAAIAAQKHAAGLDNEYTIEEVFDRWLAQVLHPRTPPARRGAIAEALVAAEVEQERRVVYPDARIVRLLAHHGADRVVGLSDFYLGERHLRRIVSGACPDLPLARIFVSSDCYVNKIKGRLFAHAQREMLADPEHHTHIGDHPWSDVESPRRFGIRAIHYLNPEEEPKRALHRARFEQRRRGDFVATSRLLADTLAARSAPPPELDPRQRELYHAGFTAAPIYAALVLGAMQEAHVQGAPAVHYFTREGEFFQRVHQAMAPAQPFGLAPPRARLVGVSRLCTFLPSLREVSTREMMRVWKLYSTQSMGQLLRTLDVSSMPFEPLLRKHGLALEPAIQHPWKDPRVQRLFADPLFIRLVEQQRDRRREVLLEYLRAQDFGRGPAVVVDIGWRGTIQDNIAHLFPGRRIVGWYLGLVRLLNDQPANAAKHAIGPDGRTDPDTLLQIIYNVSPLEMLANTDGGSVRRYERGPDGAVRAVRVHDEGEDDVWRRYTRYFQQGVLAAAPLVAEWARTFAIDPLEMRPLVLDLLRMLKANPPRVLAEAYFSLRHNETFGVGGFVEKRAELAPELLRKGEESRGSDPEFVAAVEATDWPQGLLKLLGRDELCRQYNRFREDRAMRNDQRRARQASAPQLNGHTNGAAQLANGTGSKPSAARA